jgi:hypothetical protein
MKINKKEIRLSDQGNFILALLLIHFVFFGYICNVYGKSLGDRIIFLDLVLFNPASFFSSIILFLIIMFVAGRERFYEYGIRNSLWLIPFIILESLIWYWIINGFSLSIIGLSLINLHFYLTILSLILITFTAALAGTYLKIQYLKYQKGQI